MDKVNFKIDTHRYPLIVTVILYNYENHIYVYIYIYIYSKLPIYKSDSQGTGKIVRLSDMSDLSEIHNIMLIIHATRMS